MASTSTSTCAEVHLDIGIKLSSPDLQLSKDLDSIKEEHDKVIKELDALYNDYKILDEQFQVLERRNAALEERCGYAEAKALERKDKLNKLQTAVVDYTEYQLKKVESGEESNQKISKAGPEKDLSAVLCSDNVVSDEKGKDNLLAENESLRGRLEQVAMLLTLWEQRCHASEMKNQRLEKMLSVLRVESFQEGIHVQLKDVNEDFSTRAKKSRGSRFRREPCRIQECKNCHRFFEADEPGTDLCLYHPQRPLSSTEWHRLFHGLNEATCAIYKDWKFWTCCEKFGRKAPKGCVIGLHMLEEKTELSCN